MFELYKEYKMNEKNQLSSVESSLYWDEPTYLMSWFEEHPQDFFSEVQRIESTKDPNSLEDVTICFWVKPKGLFNQRNQSCNHESLNKLSQISRFPHVNTHCYYFKVKTQTQNKYYNM